MFVPRSDMIGIAKVWTANVAPLILHNVLNVLSVLKSLQFNDDG